MNKPLSNILSIHDEASSMSGTTNVEIKYAPEFYGKFQNYSSQSIQDFWTLTFPYQQLWSYSTKPFFDNPFENKLIEIEQKIIGQYENKISELQSEINELRATLSEHIVTARKQNELIDTFQYKDVTPDHIKNYILENVKIGEVFYPSDIADKLGIDMQTTMEIINSLKKEGKLGNFKTDP